MTLSKETEYGQIVVSNEALAKIAGDSASECYGVVGLTKKGGFSSRFVRILKPHEFYNGMAISRGKKGYKISLYLVIARGVKIPEILNQVQKKIKYDVEKYFSIKLEEVNVYAQDIK